MGRIPAEYCLLATRVLQYWPVHDPISKGCFLSPSPCVFVTVWDAYHPFSFDGGLYSTLSLSLSLSLYLSLCRSSWIECVRERDIHICARIYIRMYVCWRGNISASALIRTYSVGGGVEGASRSIIATRESGESGWSLFRAWILPADWLLCRTLISPRGDNV